jgi:hypothetical protein
MDFKLESVDCKDAEPLSEYDDRETCVITWKDYSPGSDEEIRAKVPKVNVPGSNFAEKQEHLLDVLTSSRAGSYL